MKGLNMSDFSFWVALIITTISICAFKSDGDGFFLDFAKVPSRIVYFFIIFASVSFIEGCCLACVGKNTGGSMYDVFLDKPKHEEYEATDHYERFCKDFVSIPEYEQFISTISMTIKDSPKSLDLVGKISREICGNIPHPMRTSEGSQTTEMARWDRCRTCVTIMSNASRNSDRPLLTD
jgi:hypothetical protein